MKTESSSSRTYPTFTSNKDDGNFGRPTVTEVYPDSVKRDVSAESRCSAATAVPADQVSPESPNLHFSTYWQWKERQPLLRAIVPVDLRSPDRALELGNAFGLTFLDLPLNEPTPDDRLRASKSGMDALKQSPEARAFLNILGLFGQLPHTVEDVASSLFASKASMVMTNVTGPKQKRMLAGHSVDNIVFWVPHPVSLGVGVSILSYAGNVSVGVITDAAVGLDPETITTGITRELEALTSAVNPAETERTGLASNPHPTPI